jgi:hypothetical protein
MIRDPFVSAGSTRSCRDRSGSLDCRLCGTVESPAMRARQLQPKDPPPLDPLGRIRFGRGALKPDEHVLLEVVAAEDRCAKFDCTTSRRSEFVSAKAKMIRVVKRDEFRQPGCRREDLPGPELVGLDSMVQQPREPSWRVPLARRGPGAVHGRRAGHCRARALVILGAAVIAAEPDGGGALGPDGRARDRGQRLGPVRGRTADGQRHHDLRLR